MVVRLVAKVLNDTMEPTVIYPADGANEERIALLTGIIQLVSAALEMSSDSLNEFSLKFMKSESGVIGYCTTESHIIICEGDDEKETKNVLNAVISEDNASNDRIVSKIEGAVKKRVDEIGDLWR
ncbi:hypothetical protein EU527_02840 [Candidatus Thorarchaeota archaeon]|nr:MAG: hypothetical protein EU527_02840 [Candidatus Thorarchaeota archaeon]